MNRFSPSRARAEGLRREMDCALWASAIELLQAAQDTPGKYPRAAPLDYGAYSDLALSVPDWQTFPDAARKEAEAHLRRRILRSETPGADEPSVLPRIRNFSESDFTKVQLKRLDRWFTTEHNNTLGLARADDAKVERVRGCLQRALDYMAQADPELHGELVALVDEIIVVAPDGTGQFEFTAGSSFALWGAIVANGDLLQDWTETYNTLAHEGGHLLLFAMAREQPLVLNSSDAVFKSPVRDDPRPMDGIYHAAFVASREASALDRLLAWHGQTGLLSPADEGLVAESLETSVISFWQSVEVLDRDAVLTELGSSILADCRDYMARSFALITE